MRAVVNPVSLSNMPLRLNSQIFTSLRNTVQGLNAQRWFSRSIMLMLGSVRAICFSSLYMLIQLKKKGGALI